MRIPMSHARRHLLPLCACTARIRQRRPWRKPHRFRKRRGHQPVSHHRAIDLHRALGRRWPLPPLQRHLRSRRRTRRRRAHGRNRTAPQKHPAGLLKMPQSFSRVKEVFNEWAMYRAVVDADYMHHAELVAALSAWAQRQSEPLRIVDLGCGDAWLATRAFQDANVASYRGVDVSDSASELARANIAIWQRKAEVVAGNLANFLHSFPDACANVVLASYSLHHFSSDAKVDLIAECRRILVPGGTFFWIDAVRRDGETRDSYIDRLTGVMENEWTALTPEQRQIACTHVRDSDYPETSQWMLDHVAAAGF